MIYATAGHVDHGKTSLVKAITGVDTDRLAEEKARGLTIDLGFAYCNSGKNRIGFVDVPGHAKFISNMLAGVSTIDHALVIVAADDGPMPQTIEHLAILELLGIRNATVAITKIDRVSKEHLARTKSTIAELLGSSHFSKATVFETSTVGNVGINELKKHLFTQQSDRNGESNQHFRLAIDRKFTIKGAGVVVTGSVFSGKVTLGDELWLMPSRRRVRLRGLHRQDSAAESASIGDRCALNITGDIDQTQVKRGDWITDNPNLPVSQKLDASISLISSETTPLRTGTPVHIHLGAQHTTGRVFLLNQRQLMPQETALVQIISESPISGCFNDRLVIRDQSANRTLGGGTVLDSFSVTKGRSKQERINRLELLAEASTSHSEALKLVSGDTFINQLMLEAPNGYDLEQYGLSINAPIALATYESDAKGDYYHPARVAAITTQCLKLLEAKPLTSSELRRDLSVGAALLQLILSHLISTKKLSQQGNLYALADQSPQLSKPAQALWLRVEPLLREHMLQPPIISELAKKVNLPIAALDKLLGEAIKQGLVAKPIKNRYFIQEALHELRALVIEVANQHGSQFTVIEFRDHSGLGRNLCIELLEHLDAKGFTKRLGDKRIVQDKTR